MGTLISVVVAAVILAAMIWASVRAKPLAGKRYRWATFIGIYTALIALTFFYLNYWRVPNLRLLSLAISCCAGISSFGILRRRKFGVVMWTVMVLLIILFLVGSEELNLRTLAYRLPPLSVAAMTLIYFKKRWNLFSTTPKEVTGQV